MRFEVRALQHGRVASQIVEAVDLADAQRQASHRSLHALSIRPMRTWALPAASSQRHAFAADFFVEELSTLLEAGLSVVEAIEAIHEKDRNPESRNALGAIVRGLHEGKRLSVALESLPALMPALLVAIVRAGERTGALAESLRRYATYRARVHAVRTRITSAAVYPVILLVVAAAVKLFLLGYVVPRFAAVYQGSGQHLPWLSSVLLDWGLIVAEHTVAVTAGLAAAAGLVALGARQALRQHGVAAIARLFPSLQARLQLFDLTRLYMTAGMLIGSGMPAIQALALTRDSLTPDSARRLEAATRLVANGESLTGALEAQGLATPVGLRLLNAGEGSGRIGEMLIRTADYHDAELARWIDRFTRSFEPLLMAAIGIVIGTVVVLLYMPIFDLAGSIQR